MGIVGCKPVDSLIEANGRLRSDDKKEIDVRRYQQLVGNCLSRIWPEIPMLSE